LGYAYAAVGNMAGAETLMRRYVAAMPADPNPEDSYGDILFKNGRYDEAKAHFEAALKKDPAFGPSQHELGDVFAMQGNQAAARKAYEKSARIAENARRSLEYRSSIALSYVRDGMSGFADREYTALAAEEICGLGSGVPRSHGALSIGRPGGAETAGRGGSGNS
jgi:tetratricopeptide (TPR) repeat protein